MLRSDFLLKYILKKENSEITAHVSYTGTETLGKKKKLHSFNVFLLEGGDCCFLTEPLSSQAELLLL